MKTNSWKKSGKKPKDTPKETFIEITNNSESMAQACAELGWHFGTFRKYAKMYGCYDPSKGRKWVKNTSPFQKGYKSERTISLEDIIYNNKHPQYNTGRVKRRLLETGLKEHKCEKCNLTEWNNVPIPLELNHIDGNRHNHHISNLEIICPNCHAQTDNYRGKNKI
jgi:hypothetical protein